MKIKSYLLTALFAVTLISCSKDDENTTSSNAEKQILNFSSEKEMQDKIAEIGAFKENQEAQIMEKILKRNNLKAPSANDFQNLKTVNPEVKIDEKVLLEDLKFYHTERLKAIYAERAHFNFTSIQSIADEINSLKLLNPKKANALSNKYSNLLLKNEYSVNPKSVNSEVTNVNGKISLNNNPIASKLSDIKQGMVVSTALYAITYHVGLDVQGGIVIIPQNDKLFTKLASYVNFGGGYVSYPSWFYTNPDSNCLFSPGIILGCPNFYVPFPSGTGATVTYEKEVGSACNGWYKPYNGTVSGAFVTPIGNTFMTLNGSKTF